MANDLKCLLFNVAQAIAFLVIWFFLLWSILTCKHTVL